MIEKPVEAYIGVGANLGDRESAILEAVGKLSRLTKPAECAGASGQPELPIPQWAGVDFSSDLSSVFESTPVGGPPGQSDFLNLVIRIRTVFPPGWLLAELRGIERAMGRAPGVRWGPRRMDLDLLLYGDRVVEEPGLSVPHPRIAERRFVLEPLAELAPDLPLPGLGRSVGDLCREARTRLAGQRVARLGRLVDRTLNNS